MPIPDLLKRPTHSMPKSDQGALENWPSNFGDVFAIDFDSSFLPPNHLGIKPLQSQLLDDLMLLSDKFRGLEQSLLELIGLDEPLQEGQTFVPNPIARIQILRIRFIDAERLTNAP
jgi:hypothetical protein